MLNLKTLFTGTSLALACLSVMAQSATPRVDQREARQDQRIENGVASGELNAKETYRLEQQQARIHQAENNAKADGHVSAKERRHLHQMQDRASRNIYRQKHDAQTAR